MFPDHTAGDAAMRDLMLEKNGHKTFAQALPSYAPPHENDVGAYQRAVQQHSGLDLTTRTISSYSPEEFDRLIAAMRSTNAAARARSTRVRTLPRGYSR